MQTKTQKKIMFAVGALTVALSAVSSLVLAPSAFADAPDYVRLRSLSFAGSGCPAGSVSMHLSGRDLAVMQVDSFVAQVGPGTPFVEKRKFCQLNVDLEYPQGWSYTLGSIDTRGYASLERGVNAEVQTAYYFQGQGATARLRTTLSGPFDRDYQVRDTLGLSGLIWSPCGVSRSLNLSTQVRLDNSRNPRGSGLISVDSIDGWMVQSFSLQWRRC